MQNDQLKKNIMRRIYTVYILKSVAQPLILELLMIAALIAMAGLFVSLKHIFMNMYGLNGIQEISQFFVSAFVHTTTIVKLIIIGGSVAGILFIWDSVRRIRRAFEYRT
jgi:hypothetical protein